VDQRIIISTRPRFLVNRRLRWKWSTKTPAQEFDSESDDLSDEEPESRPVEEPRVPWEPEPIEHRPVEEPRARDVPEPLLVDGRESRMPDQHDDSEPGHEARLGRGLRERRPRRFFDRDIAWSADA
jgi:hypothetical protein